MYVCVPDMCVRYEPHVCQMPSEVRREGIRSSGTRVKYLNHHVGAGN